MTTRSLQGVRETADDVDAYLIVYSVTDRNSFAHAQACLLDVQRRGGRGGQGGPQGGREGGRGKAVAVLVANKQDLVRNRTISTSGEV